MTLRIISKTMNLTKENKELRTFGLSLGLGLMVISTVLRLRGKPYICLPPLSVLIVSIAFIKPVALKILKGFLERVIKIITAVITWVLLLFLFYIIVTPLGIIAGLFRRRFLRLGFEDVPSYFEKREKYTMDKAVYERQF